ncbi:MAG TPA: rod shape-determining protein [Clostridiales bacterium]|nr:rod shape-determining protein [Clostridiales bacterium]
MSTNIGIDLGSSKTILFSGSNIVLEEPSVAIVDTDTWEPLYFGEKAFKMVGRTSEYYTAVFPIEYGVIADYGVAEQMVRYFMRKAFGNRILKPKVIVTVPSGVTSVQHRWAAKAVEASGARNVLTIESPIAAAIGLGIDFSKPRGNMIIDIGAGTTDIAVISMGGIATCDSARVASSDFDNAIIRHIRKEHNMQIGLQSAQNIKKQIGSVVPRPIEIAIQAKGSNLFTGMPQIFEVTSSEIYEALKEPALNICKAIQAVLEKTEPDLVSDILQDGIMLTGGGALIYGMEQLLSEYLGARVTIAPDPLHSVVKGAITALKNPELLKNGNYRLRSIQDLIIE